MSEAVFSGWAALRPPRTCAQEEGGVRRREGFGQILVGRFYVGSAGATP